MFLGGVKWKHWSEMGYVFPHHNIVWTKSTYFSPMFYFYNNPPKTTKKPSDNQRFSDVFRGYRNEKLDWNGLIKYNQTEKQTITYIYRKQSWVSQQLSYYHWLGTNPLDVCRWFSSTRICEIQSTEHHSHRDQRWILTEHLTSNWKKYLDMHF